MFLILFYVWFPDPNGTTDEIVYSSPIAQLVRALH